MKKSLLNKTLLALTALMTINACSESNTVTPQVTVPFTMAASSSAPTVAKLTPYEKILEFILPSSYAFMPASMVDSTGLVISLTNAWIMIDTIEFETDEVGDVAEVDGDEIEFTGPYAVDLLATTATVLDTQTIPQIPFKRIKMKLHMAESAVSGAPGGLTNNSIYITGSIGANSFTYQSSEETEVEIGGPNAVVPVDGQGIAVEIQLANVFKQINLSGIPNGAVISASSRYAGANLCPAIDVSASDVFTCVRNGLEQEADCGSDEDGDGDLEVDEDSVN